MTIKFVLVEIVLVETVLVGDPLYYVLILNVIPIGLLQVHCLHTAGSQKSYVTDATYLPPDFLEKRGFKEQVIMF